MAILLLHKPDREGNMPFSVGQIVRVRDDSASPTGSPSLPRGHLFKVCDPSGPLTVGLVTLIGDECVNITLSASSLEPATGVVPCPCPNAAP